MVEVWVAPVEEMAVMEVVILLLAMVQVVGRRWEALHKDAHLTLRREQERHRVPYMATPSSFRYWAGQVEEARALDRRVVEAVEQS